MDYYLLARILRTGLYCDELGERNSSAQFCLDNTHNGLFNAYVQKWKLRSAWLLGSDLSYFLSVIPVFRFQPTPASVSRALSLDNISLLFGNNLRIYLIDNDTSMNSIYVRIGIL